MSYPARMNGIVVDVSPDRDACGQAAATRGAELLRAAIESRGEANIIVATGASQFEMIAALVRTPGIAWEKVTAFHLDEYVGLPPVHPASFRKYLWERFHRLLPLPLRAFHYVAGEGDPHRECRRLAALIRPLEIDVCFAGIGENAHLAFNDPPADFAADEPYAVVNLDAACRQQQLGEGWFPDLTAVPTQAISMSIRQIMKSRAIVVTAPDERKARAIQASVEGPVTPRVPSSILQQHPNTWLYLDRSSAALLNSRNA